jgi:hypothetical protein
LLDVENVDKPLNDEQMNKKNLIKNCNHNEQIDNNLSNNKSNRFNEQEQQTIEQINDQTCDHELNNCDKQINTCRKESIAEKMDTDINELFITTKDEQSIEDRCLTEDEEQMDISQCDQLKSTLTIGTSTNDLYNDDKKDTQPQDDNHLTNGSYASSLCSTPSDLSADVNLVYIDTNEQMDTNNQLDLKKKSVNEILLNDNNVISKKQCSNKENDVDKNDNQIDNQFKDQSSNNNCSDEIKEDNLSSNLSSNSSEKSSNNSNTRLPDEVSLMHYHSRMIETYIFLSISNIGFDKDVRRSNS